MMPSQNKVVPEMGATTIVTVTDKDLADPASPDSNPDALLDHYLQMKWYTQMFLSMATAAASVWRKQVCTFNCRALICSS